MRHDYIDIPRFSCPNCNYKTNHKGHMSNHIRRKNACSTEPTNALIVSISSNYVRNRNIDSDLTQVPTALTVDNIPIVHTALTVDNVPIIDNVPTVPIVATDGEKIPAVTNIQNNFTIHQSIINNFNILTNPDIVSQIAHHVSRLQYGKSTIYNRFDPIKAIVDNGKNITKKDVITLTEHLTKTTDTQRFSDAYYTFDKANINYSRRIDDDNHIWKWEPCSFKDILKDIIEQLIDYVFKEYEIKLNNKFAIDNNPTYLEKFYTINKYLLIKPICTTVEQDNQALYFTMDNEYYIRSGNELCKKLNHLFDTVHVDIWEMAKFRIEIEELVETNGQNTFDMIQSHILKHLSGEPADNSITNL